MAKRNFKLKFSCFIPYFHLCRSKKPSKLPETSISVIHWLSSPPPLMNPKASGVCYPDLNFPVPPPSTPDDSFIKRHLSPKVGCSCRARSCSIQYLSPDVSFESAEKKEATRLHIMAMEKVRDSKLQWRSYEASFFDDFNGDVASVLGSKIKVNKKEKMEKMKAIANVSALDHSGCFSSELGDENEETETLISTSRSFSDDSSFELDQSMADDSHLEIKMNKKKVQTTKKKEKMKRPRSFGSKTKAGAQGSILKQAKTTMIPPPSTTEGKVRESVAVVKKSEDPYQDFKRSMLEMILEKQMFEAQDLEQLLQCFLSLNSKQYHRIIVEAFTEIWEALFCDYLHECSCE